MEKKTTAGRPYVHDVTGDGIDDVVSVYQLVFAEYGLPEGGLGPAQTLNTVLGGVVSDVVFADLDHDGFDDVLLCSEDEVGWSGIMHASGGAGGLGPLTFLQLTNHCRGFALADFNGDGWMDLAWTDDSTTLRVRPGTGGASFSDRLDGPEPRAQDIQRSGRGGGVVAGDFNEDGLIDLVTLGEEPGGTIPPGVMEVFLAATPGHWVVPSTPVSTDAVDLWSRAVHLDADSHLDLLGSPPWVYPIAAPIRFLGNGLGGFAATPLNGEGVVADTSDLDGDGLLDVLLQTPVGSRVLLQRPVDWERGPLLRIFAPHFWDGDGDGRLDIAGSDGDPFHWKWARSSGPLDYRAAWVTAFPAVVSFRVLNAEGTALLVWDHFTVSVATAQSALFHFLPSVAGLPPSMQVIGAFPGQFTTDGIPDVAVSLWDGSATTLAIVQGTVTGLLDPPVVLTGLDASLIAVGDVTRDGLDDLIQYSTAGANHHLLLRPSLGDGSFGAAAEEPLIAALDSMVIADVNHDGINDIIACEGWIVETMLGVPGGGYTHIQATDGLTMQAFTSAAADMDGDGNLDLLTPQGELTGRGDGTFFALEVNTNPFVPFFGSRSIVMDANHDGLLDVVHSLGGGARFSMNRGQHHYETTTLSVGTGSNFKGDAFGDYFGTGNYSIAVVQAVILEPQWIDSILVYPCTPAAP